MVCDCGKACPLLEPLDIGEWNGLMTPSEKSGLTDKMSSCDVLPAIQGLEKKKDGDEDPHQSKQKPNEICREVDRDGAREEPYGPGE